jgi:hypothetical protein
MIGEALTTRLKLTLHIRLQFLGADLDCIDTGTTKGQDEIPSIHPRDLRPPALRDQATTVPMDRRRSRANSSGDGDEATTSSGSSIVMVDTL